jgi:diguanylate cyclase (GGDEF)-like protein
MRPPADERTEEVVSDAAAAGPGRRALLVCIYPAGPLLGARFPLGEEPLVLGRDPGCGARLDDPSVSRRHARVEPGGGGYAVTDLGSTNGVTVNRLPARHAALRDGDYLGLGRCILRFLAGGNAEAAYHEEIYRLATVDALTETHNRRHLMECLARELARSGRRGGPLSLVLLDIDHFKRVNDALGHLAGDGVLRELADRVRPAVRRGELFARYGGEEFALVLPGAGAAEAGAAAERVRGLVEGAPFAAGGGRRVTVSLGVATAPGDVDLSPEELLRRADENLYRAKAAGRNCVRA